MGLDSVALGRHLVGDIIPQGQQTPIFIFVEGGTAIGAGTHVAADHGTAVGAHSVVTAADATALGYGAQAIHANFYCNWRGHDDNGAR